MKIEHSTTIASIVATLVLTSLIGSAIAQDVSIPDPGLNAAIREALQIPQGSLTEGDMLSLIVLEARGRNVKTAEGLETARNLVAIDLESNLLTNFSLPSSLTNLETLDLGFNALTNCFIPSGLTNLAKLELLGNLLTNLILPADLIGLSSLGLSDNQLTSLTLPPGVQQLDSFSVDANPLTTLVLSEPLAATNLAVEVASLRNQGVAVFTYPTAVSLISPHLAEGAFAFTISGPPGVFTVLGSTDLVTWSELGAATNLLGSADFTDITAGLSTRKFYRARQ